MTEPQLDMILHYGKVLKNGTEINKTQLTKDEKTLVINKLIDTPEYTLARLWHPLAEEVHINDEIKFKYNRCNVLQYIYNEIHTPGEQKTPAVLNYAISNLYNLIDYRKYHILFGLRVRPLFESSSLNGVVDTVARRVVNTGSYHVEYFAIFIGRATNDLPKSFVYSFDHYASGRLSNLVNSGEEDGIAAVYKNFFVEEPSDLYADGWEEMNETTHQKNEEGSISTNVGGKKRLFYENNKYRYIFKFLSRVRQSFQFLRQFDTMCRTHGIPPHNSWRRIPQAYNVYSTNCSAAAQLLVGSDENWKDFRKYVTWEELQQIVYDIKH